MRRIRSLSFDTELSGLIVLVANGSAWLSMGFTMVAIDETLMDRCASFEASLRKRGNYGTARLSKTGAANLTVFIARRLPCFTSSAARSNSRRLRGYGLALPAPSRREDRAANGVRSHALSSPR